MFRGGRQVFQVGQAPSVPTVIRPLRAPRGGLRSHPPTAPQMAVRLEVRRQTINLMAGDACRDTYLDPPTLETNLQLGAEDARNIASDRNKCRTLRLRPGQTVHRVTE